MRNRPTLRRRPAPAQGITGIIDVILQILAVLDALYNVFTSLFGGAR